MFSIFRKKKEAGRKKKNKPKETARKSGKESRTVNNSGGIVQPTPPVATKRVRSKKENITPTDVAKIWEKKPRRR